uniref:Uncharacterized protein n=1 Tax=Haptolina brevifila TaxID=156173 RepID=A0A7S2J6Y6_9EUKA
MSAAQASSSGANAVLFGQAFRAALAVGSTDLSQMVNSTPTSGCTSATGPSYLYYYYGDMLSNESASPAVAWSPSPPMSGTCFGADYMPVAACKCHHSCASCGYAEQPTSMFDCITCAHGGPVTPVYVDGTGTCTPTLSPKFEDLRMGCYKACDAAEDFPAEYQSTGGCTDTCTGADDGYCDDGGAGSEYYFCALSTDCKDCGPRSSTTPLPPLSPPPLPKSPSSPPGATCPRTTTTDGNIATCLNWCLRRPDETCERCDCSTCEACISAPPNPLPPSLPALAPGQSASYVVEAKVRAAGDVSDYDATTLSSLKTKLSGNLGVDASTITVSVAGGSVLLTIAIATSDPAQSSQVTSTLQTNMGASRDASAYLGVAVEQVMSIEATAQVIDGTSSGGGLSTGAIIGIVVGVVGGLLLLILLLWLWKRKSTAKVVVKAAA